MLLLDQGAAAPSFRGSYSIARPVILPPCTGRDRIRQRSPDAQDMQHRISAYIEEQLRTGGPARTKSGVGNQIAKTRKDGSERK